MKGILVDPFSKTVTKVEVTEDYRDIYRVIQASTFDCVRIDERNAIFIDDEGLYVEDQRFFSFRGYAQPLAGRGFILGNDREGNSVSCTITLEDVRSRVTWPDVALAGFKEIPEGATTDHPVLGPNTPIIGQTPVFGPSEEAFLIAIINTCGTNEHPLATKETLKYFQPKYIRECVIKAIETGTLSAVGASMAYKYLAKQGAENATSSE